MLVAGKITRRSRPEAAIANETFFEVVAQTIPLIFLVLVVQYRETPLEWKTLAVSLRLHPATPHLLALVVTVFLGLAEFAALDILWRQEVGRLTGTLVAVGLTVGAVALFAPLLLAQLSELRGKVPAYVIVSLSLGILVIAALAAYYFTRPPLR